MVILEPPNYRTSCPKEVVTHGEICCLEKSFFFFSFLATPVAYRNSLARDQIHTTAETTPDS